MKRIIPVAERQDSYNFFGEKVERNQARGIILHTRMATCAINLTNVHPFIDPVDTPQIALIHNGGISNHRHLTKKIFNLRQ